MWISFLILVSFVTNAKSTGSAAEPLENQYGIAVFNVRNFGAHGDGSRMDTQAIQAAIDACFRNKGGTVIFPAGKYLTGTIFMRSNVNLQLSAEAVLLGSKNLDDYATYDKGNVKGGPAPFNKCLIYAENERNFSLTGKGTIDGQGGTFPYASLEQRWVTGSNGMQTKGMRTTRPMLMRFINCRNMSIEDLTLKNAASWCSMYVSCDDVRLDGVTIDSHVNKNNDGLDIDSCQNFFISNCRISSQDDAICLKSEFYSRSCRNIVVTNCIVRSERAALKFGTSSASGFQNITVSNCAFYDCDAGGAIKLLMVDGGRLDGVVISNISMDNVAGPLFICLGSRHRKYQQSGVSEIIEQPIPAGILKNVTISNIRANIKVASKNRTGIFITGLPDRKVENIVLDNIHIVYPGGGTDEDAKRVVPENGRYVEPQEFGVRPSYGLYIRHANRVALNNIRFDLEAADMRPAIACNDVKDLEISGFSAQNGPEANSLIRLIQTQDAFIHSSRALDDIKVFMSVEGQESRQIILMANDLHKAKSPVETIKGAQRSAVVTLANVTK
jgi:polygalacturonase